MKKIAIVLVGMLVLSITAGAVAMNDLHVSGTWRYKMTVKVDTPEGLMVGSAVREMSNSKSKIKIIDLPQGVNPAKVIGEAVVVDLGQRGKLFALMSGYKWGPDHANSIIYDVFPSGKGGTTMEGIEFYKNLKSGPRVLTLEQYPRLVAFRDITDPKSVMPVLEVAISDDRPRQYSVEADHSEELFGRGVRIKEITMEMTDEPITLGVIDTVLPKFDVEFQEWRRKLPHGDARRVMKPDFRNIGE